MEEKLFNLGKKVGWRLIDLVASRSKKLIRYNKIHTVLQFITQQMWKILYHKSTDQLQKSTEDTNIFYIYENDPTINRFITLPKELKNSLNCANFNAGIMKAVLTGYGFEAEVKTLTVQASEADPIKTVYQIIFSSLP